MIWLGVVLAILAIASWIVYSAKKFKRIINYESKPVTNNPALKLSILMKQPSESLLLIRIICKNKEVLRLPWSCLKGPDADTSKFKHRFW